MAEPAEPAPNPSRRTVTEGGPSSGRTDALMMAGTPDLPERRSSFWIWGIYVLLFALSVPWYLPAGGPLRLWFGLPHWVVLSLSAYLAVAVFTVYVVARHWPAPPAGRDPDDREGAP